MGDRQLGNRGHLTWGTRFRRYRRVLSTVGLLVLVGPVLIAHAEPSEPSGQAVRFAKTEPTSVLQDGTRPRSVDADGKVRVMVQLTGDPVAVVQAKQGRRLSAEERSVVKQDLRRDQAALARTIQGKGGKVESQVQSAYNGLQVTLPSKQVDSVAALPGVAGVHAVSIQTIDTATSLSYLGVPQVWQQTGYTGKGVKIAVIDTGIDYTHADFGGLGTPEAFAAAKDSIDPAQFGPQSPRVKGGYDFVGDDYDADAAAGSPKLVAHPDNNPLDCDGHGSHVAGTAAGGGVTADGTTYTGPYDAATASVAFKVGPGVAPQADLYALRVFGCSGSTDVTTAAIDWAVDHDMDVINLSLGSDFGTADDPVAVAASNAVGAGIVVVASAGNAGSSPYLVGAPSVADGVIAVAAVDDTQAFAGATLTFAGRTLAARNANGAPLPSDQLTLVVLKDKAGTSEDESLGCSADAYLSAGIESGKNQLAVVTRGTCARAAKPIYGQQAGAAAVLMVNTESGYPPSEGEITSNPDDGVPYTVTIPFLGVLATDADELTAGDGDLVSLAAGSLPNPGFQGYASFSSSGPRTGDSAISPNVAAPGVSIASVGIGTGNGAAVMSGTSMAAPHVSGIACLTVQAHPGWSSQDLSAAITSTADPDKVPSQQSALGGLGLVDAAQAVATQVTVTGDSFATSSGHMREAALSFGFAEPEVAFAGSRTLTITNHGTRSVTYKLSSSPSAQSLPASVSLSARSVTVRPGGQARVRITLKASVSAVGSSIGGDDQFNLKEVSGSIVATSASGVLRVPYLLVPRAQSNVGLTAGGTSRLSFAVNQAGKPGTPGSTNLRLTNVRATLAGAADFYTWGLSDARDVRGSSGGYDLRAVGVQSFATSDTDQQLVFAVNTYSRWSNAASREFDINIDNNNDGDPDLILFSGDSGAIRDGAADGVTEVFVYDPASGDVTPAGYQAVAPTDSSTMLLPVDASTLGLSAAAGTFGYSAAGYEVTGPGWDEMPGTATYNPWAKAIVDGDYVTVAPNRFETVTVVLDPSKYSEQKPLGIMVVALDNQSGARESILVSGR